MTNFVINNETETSVNLPPFLIKNLIYWRYEAMTDRTIPQIPTKICTKCGTEKPLSEFYKRSDRDTYLSWCKNCKNESDKGWVADNREKHRELCDKWYLDNKEKHLEDSKEWYQNNKHRKLETTTAREKRCVLATPAWADRELMKSIYALVREMTEATGIPYEVDHIIPLQGKNVCGLHVHNNLQVLTQEENRHKGNKYHRSWIMPGDDPEGNDVISKAVAKKLHKPEVVIAYKAKMAELSEEPSVEPITK